MAKAQQFQGLQGSPSPGAIQRQQGLETAQDFWSLDNIPLKTLHPSFSTTGA